MSRMVYIETIVFNGNNINERAKINSKITVHKNVFLAKLKTKETCSHLFNLILILTIFLDVHNFK